MRNLPSSIPQPSISVGIDTAIGQIDLIGESGDIVKSWSIRSPRCTIGSGLDCSIQIVSPGVASLHVTLIFGKKHTLLRSTGPTLISNRHVREWLIDHSTEIVVGQSRLVVHPSMGVLATVVHAERLIDQAARLCKELTPLIPEPTNAIVQNSQVLQPNTSENSVESSNDPSSPFTALSKLDSIERLLHSLQASLDRMQSSNGTDAKIANESIVESVSLGMDEFGKRLFSTLNDQLNHQTGAQQSLISNLADRLTDRFGAIDDVLSRFSETTSQQANSLKELIAQASSEQELIEARFQEVISHRNDLIEAVQVLRSEIAIAFQTPTNTTHQAAFATESQSIDAHYVSENDSDAAPPIVTDAQLADSLERAQVQIHELNHQLRTLETERDFAQHRVARLAESLQTMQAASQFETVEQFHDEVAQHTDPQHQEPQYTEPQYTEPQYEEPQYEEPQYEEAQYEEAQYEAPQYEEPQYEEPQYEEPQYEEPQYQEPQYEEAQYEEAQYEEPQYEEPQYEEPQYQVPQYQEPQYEEAQYREPQYREPQYGEPQYGEPQVAADPTDETPFEDFRSDEPCSEIRQLPDWFKQDEPETTSDDSLAQSSSQVNSSTLIDSGPHFANFAASSLNRYSEDGYESEQIELTDQSMDPSKDKLDSISERLQRMLYDADQRRGTSSSMRQVVSDPSKENHDEEPAPPLFSEDHSSIVEFDSESPSENVQNSRLNDSDQQLEQNANEDAEIENRQGTIEEESIEQYMQRLLNRVRGGGESEIAATPPPALTSPALATSTSSSPELPQPSVAASMGLGSSDVKPLPEAQNLGEELFVPRQQFLEQRSDLAALRELANTNARRAISRSDMRRTNSAFYVKLGITALAVSSAAALFMFNGFELNAPFAGMVSSIVVSILWGYDCINHIKRLKNAGRKNRVTMAEAAAGRSSQVGSAESSGWRPTSG